MRQDSVLSDRMLVRIQCIGLNGLLRQLFPEFRHSLPALVVGGRPQLKPAYTVEGGRALSARGYFQLQGQLEPQKSPPPFPPEP